MEALLAQATKGIHILFDNHALAEVLKDTEGEKDFYSFDNVKKVQNTLVELMAKKNYIDKVSFIESLDSDNYKLLIRAYFHIVENAARNQQFLKH